MASARRHHAISADDIDRHDSEARHDASYFGDCLMKYFRRRHMSATIDTILPAFTPVRCDDARCAARDINDYDIYFP